MKVTGTVGAGVPRPRRGSTGPTATGDAPPPPAPAPLPPPARLPPPAGRPGGRPGDRRRHAARAVHRLWPLLLTGTLLGLGALGLALVPVLVDSAPLLLIALRPTWAILLLTGGQVPFLPALLIAALFRAPVDIGYFGLARTNVRSVLLRRAAGGRLVSRLSRQGVERPLLWFCLVNTNAAVDVALGAGRVPPRRFLRFLVPGTLLQTTLYLLAARAVSPWTRTAIDWLDAQLTYLILGGVALALARAGLGWARDRRAAARRPADTDRPETAPDQA